MGRSVLGTHKGPKAERSLGLGPEQGSPLGLKVLPLSWEFSVPRVVGGGDGEPSLEGHLGAPLGLVVSSHRLQHLGFIPDSGWVCVCPRVRLALSASSPHSEGNLLWLQPASLASLLVYESKTPSWNIWRVGKSMETGKKSLQLESVPALNPGRVPPETRSCHLLLNIEPGDHILGPGFLACPACHDLSGQDSEAASAGNIPKGIAPRRVWKLSTPCVDSICAPGFGGAGPMHGGWGQEAPAG